MAKILVAVAALFIMAALAAWTGTVKLGRAGPETSAQIDPLHAMENARDLPTQDFVGP